MDFIQTWNEHIPAGTDSVSYGDDSIRNLKFAIRERLAREHCFYASEAGRTDVGKHKSGFCGTDYLASNAVTTSKIMDGAVTLAKLAEPGLEVHAASVSRVEQVVPALNVWSTLVSLGPISGQRFCVLLSSIYVYRAAGGLDYKVAFTQNGINRFEGKFFSSASGIVDSRIFAIGSFPASTFEVRIFPTRGMETRECFLVLIYA